MKGLSQIWFPVAAVAFTVASMNISEPAISEYGISSCAPDTVTYKVAAYKTAGAKAANIADSLLKDNSDFLFAVIQDENYIDPRDTIHVPDSLKETDPLRYKYYVALMDSTVRAFVRDSLILARNKKELRQLDSMYVADSLIQAEIRFQNWYNSLDRKQLKEYKYQLRIKRQMAIADSLDDVKAERKAVRDSILEETPRILETFALPDSMQYKKIIQWTVNPDFQKFGISEPDTTYNDHFYDNPFRKQDVNATWLGVSGSPVQNYNYFKRQGNRSNVEYYDVLESWTYDVSSVKHYNSKTPFTELAYYGALFAGAEKESDNLHFFTTQNITPKFNLAVQLDRWGGGGWLSNHKVNNNSIVVNTNYLGKKYTMHLGYIRNYVTSGENGGVTDIKYVQDMHVDSRSIPVNDNTSTSRTMKNTVYLDQLFRIQFANADSLNKNVTSAFLGHSTEYSSYTRDFTKSSDDGTELKNRILDNKVFIKLQPWKEDFFISKLNVGAGDLIEKADTCSFNTVYIYGGVEGRVKKYFDWNAKVNIPVAGHRAGGMNLVANANFHLFPFIDRFSPLTVGGRFSITKAGPSYYQQHFHSSQYKWDNDFGLSTTTKIEAFLDIPKWNLRAEVGYGILNNTIYYDSTAIVRQNNATMNIFSASVRKDFVIGGLHLDNKVLFQTSSDQTVVPVPMLSFNLKYYFQFVAQWNETRTKKALEMQIGINAYYNTLWNSPAWNGVTGTFYNQRERKYNNGPVFDLFINCQWQRVTVFVKVENILDGAPFKKRDYFSADRYILPSQFLPSLKFGVYWPFFISPIRNNPVSID